MPHPHLRKPRNATGKVKPVNPVPRMRQLLLDVTQTAVHDIKTGIQRVVRSLLFELVRHPPEGFVVEAVYTPPGGHGHFYARGFLHRLGLGPDGQDSEIRVGPGDLFLTQELSYEAVLNQPDVYRSLRRAGVKTYAIVYDLIPIALPEACTPRKMLAHAKWLSILAEGNGLVCISRTVADEVMAWLNQHDPVRNTPLSVGWFHLGADMGASIPTKGLPGDAPERLAAFRARPTFLMVGTLEPRKAQRQALDAFGLLWARGLDVNLVFVGRGNWSVEKLTHQLRSKRLQDSSICIRNTFNKLRKISLSPISYSGRHLTKLERSNQIKPLTNGQ